MYTLKDSNIVIKLGQYEIDDRGYLLSKHPYNYGYFRNIHGGNDKYVEKLNFWVDKQREYCKLLPLETQSGLLLLQSQIGNNAFRNTLDPLEMIENSNGDIRQLFETVPCLEQINRYSNLIQEAIINCPKIPFDLEIITNTEMINDDNFLLLKAQTLETLDNVEMLEKRYNKIIIKKGTSLIYMNCIFGIKRMFLFDRDAFIEDNVVVEGVHDKFHTRTLAIDDDALLYMNAKKETLEESEINIENMGPPLCVVDFPLHLQKEYCGENIYNANVIVPRAHGIVGSGTLFVCREDKTMLLFQRSYIGDFGGTWAGTGGAIGEDRTVVYKSSFMFRTFIYELSKKQKVIWKGLDLPRINYEHSQHEWFDYGTILSQLDKFGNPDDYNVSDKVTRFLRAYETQIPMTLPSLECKENILSTGKFPLYIYNQNSKKYELIIPGTSYTIWHIKDRLK